ncbi:multiheme c-type cytochrome [Geopsychrobacter electrodiphilus]|uniref:multiheme c-type cytochrome n=1 Tax=Geopsychrobacter electrodiphilus TaxID=225196 RepID=UPI000364F5D1|nr:hypothetical protein [Geopsychrobacter electrodiphilus]
MKKLKLMLLIGLIALVAGLSGCASDGSNGAAGADGAPGLSAYQIAANNGYTGTEAEFAAALTAANDATPESCAVCHKGAGDQHQAYFNATKDASKIQLAFGTDTVTDNLDGTYTNVIPFTIDENGAPYLGGVTGNSIDGLGTQRWTIQTFDASTNHVELATLAGAPATYTLAGSGGSYTMTTTLDYDMTATGFTGFIYGYVAKDKIGGAVAGHVQLYDNVSNAALKFGTWTYTSNAAVASCEKCHGTPYMKHGYRAAQVAGIDDFVACKACHYDSRPGNDGTEFFGDGTYAYTANVMTDVHASHLNVFPYPQEMTNCVTCHMGTKLDSTLTQTNFKYSVCTTCHADVDAATNTVVAKPLSTIVPAAHPVPVTSATNCSACHLDDNSYAPSFVSIHTGVDKVKYASAADATAGTLRYTYAIDNVVYDATAATLTITWNAKDAAGAAQDVLNLDPTAGPVFLGLPADRNNESEGIRIMVAYYGWGTKNVADYDYIKKDDVIANTTYAAGVATTTFTLNSAKLADNKATKLAVAIIGVPQVNGSMVAVKSVTKDILLADGTLSDRDKVVDNAKCNACHDNIVIHTGDSHGHTTVGNVNACLFCHNTASASGHYAQQGRSIDSYLHSIHSFQTEPEFIFPTFTTTDCEACHVAGTYNVPDQTKSLGSVIDNGSVDVTVGPASRACGSCHRADALKEGDTGALAAINAHTEAMGYRVPTTVKSFIDVMNSIMAKLQ